MKSKHKFMAYENGAAPPSWNVTPCPPPRVRVSPRGSSAPQTLRPHFAEQTHTTLGQIGLAQKRTQQGWKKLEKWHGMGR